MEDKNPLSELLVDNAAEINLGRLAAFLKPYLVFSKDQSMSFLPSFNTLPVADKLELVFVAAKARSILFEGAAESLSTAEVIDLDLMPTGSIKAGVKKLFDGRRLRKDMDAKYYLPLYILNEILAQDSGSKITKVN